MSSNTTDNAFISGLKKNLDSTLITTDNGAAAYETAGGEGKYLVDFNFAITDMRGKTIDEIMKRFANVYFENPKLALRYWAYCADCRGGLGERRLSRIIFRWLIDNKIDEARKLLRLIPEYGRWDSLVELIDTPLVDDVVSLIKSTLTNDSIKCTNGENISLLAKWMPSINTSSQETVARAYRLAKLLNMRPRNYRKILSTLRAHLKVVETKMSANNWNEIDYNAVPSKANILYRNAFLKHDEIRRRGYLFKLQNGDASVKINSSTNFPCDIVHNYFDSEHSYFSFSREVKPIDVTLEQLWKNLPNYMSDKSENVLVVADTSGSMGATIGNTSVTAWELAQSLAMYFSERATGPYKDKYILFSSHPSWVDFSNCTSLRDRITKSLTYNDMSNTDIYSTMKLILNTAVTNNLSQEDIPSTLLIVSDMNFDYMCTYNCSLMDSVAREFERHGYKLPKIVFWNAKGDGTGFSIPMQTNDKGVILVSGFSPAIVRMVLSGKMTPYDAIVEALMNKRYDAVDVACGNK